MLLSLFIKNIKDNQLFQSSDELLLAVSGGVDSVVLCELCRNAGFTFSVAHANFQLRGSESENDEIFVRKLAADYQVPIYVRKFDTAHYAVENNVSIQVAAREMRYGWFNELLEGTGKYLLTAHHADDNIETVMLNFFRGTGIKGLRGILPLAGKIVRPLLPFGKKQIVSFANENNLQWREDSSNSSDKYSRNYFRNSIIPLISKIFPETEANLSENIRRFTDIEILYEQAIAVHKKKLLELRGNEVHIPVLKLKKARPLRTIIYEIIKPYHFSAHQVSEVMYLLDAEQGKMVQSSQYRIFRNRDWLIISPEKSIEADHIIISSKSENEIAFQNGVLEIKEIKSSMPISSSSLDAQLDAQKIKYPLLLRRWKQGDYFYPLGLGKKKKIARFLIDQKLSPSEKEKVWVLESEKRICWVTGLRIDDRFKITPDTKEVINLKLKT